MDYIEVVQNFDAMSVQSLAEFCEHNQSTSDRGIRELCRYANAKRTAIECRLRGRILQAQMFEEVCDDIYSKLPSNLKW